MSRFRESLRSARERINPEGAIVSTTISAASNAVMLPMEAGLTYLVHEATAITDPTLLKLAATAALGVANLASVRTQAKALKEKEYSASITGSTINILTGKPLLSSVGEHLLTYGILFFTNPINAVALISRNNELLMESAAASSFAYTFWATTWNRLIVNGRADPIVEKMRSARHSISQKFKNNQKS